MIIKEIEKELRKSKMEELIRLRDSLQEVILLSPPTLSSELMLNAYSAVVSGVIGDFKGRKK